MSSVKSISISVRLSSSADQPEILAWLETGLNLGLIAEHQIYFLASQYLACPVPELEVVPVRAPLSTATATLPCDAGSTPSPSQSNDLLPVPVPKRLQDTTVAGVAPSRPTPSTAPHRYNPPLAQVFQSLIDELSVRWLLFLGVFLVIACSGVLAANQWQRVSATGQYSILLAYTLVFWGVGIWANRQSNLNLTAQTLRLVTLLLVPINFWAMDQFGLWQQVWNWPVAAIAALILTVVTWQTLPDPASAPRLRQRGGPSLRLLNHLGLSYLHWGWVLPGLPILAGYIGVIGTTLLTVYQVKVYQAKTRSQSTENLEAPQLPTSHPFFLRGEAVWLVYALVILLGRAIFVHQVGVIQFGLALGLCGWLLAWLDHGLPQSAPDRPGTTWQVTWQVIGGSLILLGWCITINGSLAQAFSISVLALDMGRRRLWRHWLAIDLFAIFGIGLQTLWLGWRLLPAVIQQALVDQLYVISEPILWLGVLLIPYGALFLGVSQWFDQQQKSSLARFTDGLVLAFQAFLILISLLNPLTRFLNLLGSTVLLGWTTYRYWQQGIRLFAATATVQLTYPGLVYVTHSLGISTVLTGIYLWFPQLGLFGWAVILLGFMLLEWLFSFDRGFSTANANTSPNPPSPPSFRTALLPWKESAWYLGLALAGASYLLLLSTRTTTSQFLLHPWSFVWLATPLALTGLASLSASPRRLLTSHLSTATLLFAQVLALPFEGTRLLGLSLAFVLMLVNTYWVRHWFSAVLTVGFGLAALVAGIAEGRLGFAPTLDTWFMVGTIVPASLWLLRTGLIRQPTPLRELYSQAIDGWAILLVAVVLTPLTILPWSLSPAVTPSAMWGSALLMIMSVTYRSWDSSQRSQSIGWSILVLLLTQAVFIRFPQIRWVGLGLATVLMAIHTYLLDRLLDRSSARESTAGVQPRHSAALTIGFGLSFLMVLLWEYWTPLHQLFWSHWLLVGSLSIAGLWVWWAWLIRQTGTLAQVYTQAANGWAIFLTTIELLFLTVHSAMLYGSPDQALAIFQPSWLIVGAVVITILAILGRNWRHPSNWTIYSIGWGLELLSAEALSFTSRSSLHLAVATIALGLATQLLGDWWRHQHRTQTEEDLVLSGLHVMPLLYGALASLLRIGNFTSWTGLASAGIALIVIGVGRRTTNLKPLTYLGVIGISVAAYEYLLYRLLQTSGGAIGDGLIALAALGTTLMLAYQTLWPWLKLYLNLTTAEIKIIAHLHWGLSIGLLVMAMSQPIQNALWLGLGTGVFLVQYALLQARHQANANHADLWVYLSIALAYGIVQYFLELPLLRVWVEPQQPWAGAISSLIALGLYLWPWQQLGWRQQPFKLLATLLPLGSLWQTWSIVNPISLGIAASFYAFLAQHTQRIRFSYISLALVNWLLMRWLWQVNITNLQAYAALVTASLFYLIQVDPQLRSAHQREIRHQLRLTSLALFGTITLWYQSGHGLLPALLGLMGVGIGLALRIRSFLYIGTLIFLITGFYQLVVLSFEISQLKWIIGLTVGALLIWIAASFETRREQITSLMQSWLSQLQAWE